MAIIKGKGIYSGKAVTQIRNGKKRNNDSLRKIYPPYQPKRTAIPSYWALTFRHDKAAMAMLVKKPDKQIVNRNLCKQTELKNIETFETWATTSCCGAVARILTSKSYSTCN